MKDGRHVAADIDLAEFFDTVNHDLLMSLLRRTIRDQRCWACDPPARPERLILKTAIQHIISSKSRWHMVRTPALQQAMSNAWLKAQGLVSVKDLRCKAQGYTT